MIQLIKPLAKLPFWLFSNIFLYLVLESNIFSPLKKDNPINKVVEWLRAGTEVNHTMLISLVCWSLGLLIYYFFDNSKIKIYKAVYSAQAKDEYTDKDVTEKIRKAVEEDGIKLIPINNEFILGPDKDIFFGVVKKLTVEYSKFGFKFVKSSNEFDRLKL